MNRHLFSIIFFSAILLWSACKKGAGEGGRASIRGKIYTVNYNSTLTNPTDSGYIGGQKVYIIYGNELAVGDNQDSNSDGAYEFKYLRKGKYKVYVYTKTSPNHLDSSVVKEIEITEKKQAVELGDFKIKTNKN